MTTVFNVSLMGRNRPGLLKELAEITHNHQGKWLNTKVNHLDSLITALIKIELPVEQLEALKAEFMAEPELSVAFVQNERVEVAGKFIEIVVDADDRAGLVNEITQRLDEECIEVVDMECNRVAVAELGRSLFTARMVLKVPNDRDGADVASELETVATDMVVTLV